MADMDAITREALRRASQLHSRSQQKQETPQAPEKKERRTQNNDSKPKQSDNGLLGNLFKDKDRSIILMLLVLLMGEDVEPSLLLALIYILL